VHTRQKPFSDCGFAESLATVRGGSLADALFTGPSPQELKAIYSGGYRAIRSDFLSFEEDKANKEFMASQPGLYEIFPWAKDFGKGKISLPYLAILQFSPTFGGDEAQLRGSCTVHSTANAAESDHANDALHGETEYMGRLVKENIYRSRGFSSDGWSCTAPASYVGPSGRGGFLYRKRYEGPDGEVIDFTNFGKKTEDWSGNGRAGVPKWLEEESAKNKARWIIPINSMEEYRDAIALMFGVSVCSGLGYDDETDENGVSRQRGSWSHAMAHLGCIDTDWAHQKYGNMVGGIQQSWGKWMKANGKPEGVSTVPTGMFFARGDDVWRMVKGGDSFAICGVWGWERSTWEAFDVGELKKHMSGSTQQDYYHERAVKGQQLAIQAYDEFLTA
jgi:hypothetical protein